MPKAGVMAQVVSSPLVEPSRARAGGSAVHGPAFELLESKLRPPHGRAGTVPRSQLIDLLEPGSGAVPVIFVSAGPGWGKTTLLTQWAARSQRPFAWVSVDANDNDPIVLLTYVATALDRVSRLDPTVFEALTSPGASIEGTVVPRLGVALATMEEAVVLVFDDLHLLDSQPCLDAIAALARHVPEGSQLVLSARGSPLCRWGRCGRAASRWRSGQTSCVWTRPRRASCSARPAWTWRTTRSRSSPSTRRAGPPVSTSRRCPPTRAAPGSRA